MHKDDPGQTFNFGFLAQGSAQMLGGRGGGNRDSDHVAVLSGRRSGD